MQTPHVGGIAVEADPCRSVIADIRSLMEHVRASLSLIERAIAREAATGSQENADVLVLDDVTPCYAKATAALNACDTHLAIALHALLDTGTRETIGAGNLAATGTMMPGLAS